MSGLRAEGDRSPERRPDPEGATIASAPGAAPMSPETRAWLTDLRSGGAAHDGAVTRLHDLLLRVARAEAARRRPRLPDAIHDELDDLCAQAAGDAVVAILRKLDDFRGAARFTTWASKFVILELSTRLRRRAWRGRPIETDETIWERLADQAPTAHQSVEHRELLSTLSRAIEDDLTDRQRSVFKAAVLDEVPIDVLAERLDGSRGAIYKIVHDARRKLREALTRAGYGEKVAR